MKSSTTVSQTTPSSRIEEGPEPEDHLALGLGRQVGRRGGSGSSRHTASNSILASVWLRCAEECNPLLQVLELSSSRASLPTSFSWSPAFYRDYDMKLLGRFPRFPTMWPSPACADEHSGSDLTCT